MQAGETGEQREAQRLLEMLRPASAAAVAVAAPPPPPETVATAPAYRETPGEEVAVDPEDIVVGDWVPEEAQPPGAGEAEGAQPRAGLGRYVVPLVFVVIVLVNIVNRLLDR